VTLPHFQQTSTLEVLKKLCNTLHIMGMSFAAFQALLPAKTALSPRQELQFMSRIDLLTGDGPKPSFRAFSHDKGAPAQVEISIKR
jgi:hypothetical protein